MYNVIICYVFLLYRHMEVKVTIQRLTVYRQYNMTMR